MNCILQAENENERRKTSEGISLAYITLTSRPATENSGQDIYPELGDLPVPLAINLRHVNRIMLGCLPACKPGEGTTTQPVLASVLPQRVF
jgi:hypothetical protein